ncbi:unnamed protein product [Brassicogethes aeneus]|uniref:Uncharacterized protein n=1 Tax=Brassicogethes aeneus TaxID=1431903 RepID=A0A9P0BGH7_BRAAE|nr:unnamed protein product [Brassicogethes aeneus]
MNVVRKLRPNISKPSLDVLTRWHSTHDMLSSLLKFKDFDTQVGLSENNWADIESLVEALQPAKITAKKLQSDQLLMPDFYCAWLLCIEKTEEIDSTLAKNIVKCMKTRETKLLDNASLLSSVFLDPLLNGLLDETQQAIAKKNLCAIWYRLNQFTENQTQQKKY